MANRARPFIFDQRTVEERDYWVSHLSDQLDPSGIRPDHSRPDEYSEKKSLIEFSIDEALRDSLLNSTGGKPFLAFITLMAALKICIYKHTGNSSVVVGTPARRPEKANRSISNALAIVDEIEPSLTFRQCLLRVRQTLLTAYSRQTFPFDRLLKELGLDWINDKCALFDVMMVQEGIHDEIPEVKNDITFNFRCDADRVHCSVFFSERLFKRETIEQFAGHFVNVLRAGLSDKDTLIGDLQLLDEADRHRMLIEWNDNRTEYPRDRCVQELFEAQVERNPEAVALVFAEEQLTYRELNRRANQLAHYLRKLDLGAEPTVGVCMERSPEMVIGILGILKTGGIYAPLDPAYPKERLAFMMADTQMRAALIQQRLVERLPEYEAGLTRIDADWETIAKESEENPVGVTMAERVAYVMYTSGSTGQPKGISIPHRAISRLLFNTNYIEIKPDDRIAFASNSAFDASTFELWGALLHGAGLIGIDKEVALSPRDLVEYIRAQGITTLWITTPLFNQVAREVPGAFSSLRHALFGGEVADPHQVGAALKNGPPKRLLNTYGPTESTTFATWSLAQEALEGVASVPIGRPISNTQIYLLDCTLQPAPVNVTGELYIGGAGLAHGYLRRPDLTAEKFIPDPFGKETGARLYRTGDMARYLPDGVIDFVGRRDHQVKIRGFRIELGEIEFVLKQHPAVSDAAILARNHPPEGLRLVAYVVAHAGSPLLISDLRRFLKNRLPDYLTPSAFVTLDALPLTRNGKLDRAVLLSFVPSVGMDELSRDQQFVEVRTPVEEVLKEIWTEMLNIERISLHDNFFDLGGHSLLATRIMSRVREAFTIDSPLRVIFETPTIAGLAEHVEASIRGAQVKRQPTITRVARDKDLPLSFAQQRIWFIQALDPKSPIYNMSGAISLKGDLKRIALESTLTEIIRRHEALRTAFVAREGQPFQIIKPPARFFLPLVDLSHVRLPDREAEARRLALEESSKPFDLTEGMLMRAILLQLSDMEHIVLLTMHHIASDGWSLGVLTREVAALYEAFANELPSPLPDLPIQYADFAVWQREWLQGETLDEQLSYWKQRLNGMSVLDLQSDRPRPSIPTFKGAQLSFTMPASVYDKLKALAQREGGTHYMILLAVFNILLHRYSGQTDIAIGTDIANRNRGETEGLIGFFVNQLVIRTDLSGNPTFRQILARVQEVSLGAYTHQDAPFEKLVQALQPERDLSYLPMFRIKFIFQNAFQSAHQKKLQLPGLVISPLGSESNVSQFDLTFSLIEQSGILRGTMWYSAELFDASTISRMLDQYRKLLEQVAENPETRLSDFRLLSDEEAGGLSLEDFPDAELDYGDFENLLMGLNLNHQKLSLSS